MRSAALSIPSNIAEGRGRYTPPDQLHFFVQARASALELQLETRFVGPMIEVLCVDSLPLFNLERDLAEHNYDAGMARRSQAEFKAARRRLRADLGETLRNDDLAARIFLQVVSDGEVAATEMGRDRLLAVEKDWLR